MVYEDGDRVLESAAKEIKAALARKAQVKLRAASEVSVPEVLAASAFAFGVGSSGGKSWTELRRIMTGINLAGRTAGFFVCQPGEAARLKADFAPAELHLLEHDASVSGGDAVKSWALGLITR